MNNRPVRVRKIKLPSAPGPERQKEIAPEDIWESEPQLIKRFLDIRPDYEQLCAEVAYILRKRMASVGVETSAITWRAKELTSFLDKIRRKHYENPFVEITDFAGTRVVCLYNSDLTRIADIVRNEFLIIEEVDKLHQLRVDQFGYGAMHFIVALGKSSSGARYDDLKQLRCEIQVRTVVQDAWAIIQHHMVYKREDQVPSQLQRKLNSLAALFETVDDQFERIRQERETYRTEIRKSVGKPATFHENELNLDSFSEYLKSAFPDRPLETWPGQLRLVLDNLLENGYQKLGDVHRLLEETASQREAIRAELGDRLRRTPDEEPTANLEPAIALTLKTAPPENPFGFRPSWMRTIDKYRLKTDQSPESNPGQGRQRPDRERE